MAAPVPATPLVMGWSGDTRSAFVPLTLTIPVQDPATTVGAAVATTGATDQSPFGYTGAAQADAIVARINQLRTDMIALFAEVNLIRNDLQSLVSLVNAYVVA